MNTCRKTRFWYILVRLIAGNVLQNPVTGGIELGTGLVSGASTTQLAITGSPFVSIISSGVVWDLKADLNLFPFDLADLFQGVYVGIRTQF